MKKARMIISHSRFILFKLKIFGEIVTTLTFLTTCPKKIGTISFEAVYLWKKICKMFF